MEKGNRTSSPGFSDEERARWGLPAVQLREVTYPTEIVYSAETAYPSEAADAPEATAETPDTPEATAGTADAPEVTAETADAPEATADTANTPELTAETANAPEPTADTANAPEVTAETADAPEVTAEAADAPEPDGAPEMTAEAADAAEAMAEAADAPEPDGAAEMTAEIADPPGLAAEIPAGLAAETPAALAAGSAAEAEAWTMPLPAIRARLAEGTPPAPAASAPVSGAPGPRVRPEPSWPQVLATTVRLWMGRQAGRLRGKGSPQRAGGRRLALLASMVTVVLLIAVIVVLVIRENTSRTAPPAQAGHPSQLRQSSQVGGAGSVQSAQAIRVQAAGWVLAQVSRATLVSCDPVMCAELQARGFPVGNLDVLRAGASDPLDSEVTVATGVLRSQFGSRLTSVYAPVALARFGSGSASIQVRAVAPDGAPVYLHQLSADVAARRSFGRQLVHNSDVVAGPAARRQLEQGQVDARLIAVIGTVARTHKLRILSFGDTAPGAASGVPLRSALLGAETGGSPGRTVLASVRSFVEGQQPPYLPAVARIERLPDGRYALNIRFAVPDPLGLLAMGHSLVTIPSGG